LFAILTPKADMGNNGYRISTLILRKFDINVLILIILQNAIQHLYSVKKPNAEM